MSAVLTTSAEPARSARIANITGWALIAMAVAVPVIAAVFGKMGAAQVGESIGQSLGAMVGLTVLAWLSTAKRGPIGKANGRIAVGLVLCMLSLTHVTREIREEDDAKGVLRQVMGMRLQKDTQVADLGRRFDQVDLGKILTPENMTSKAGQVAARASLAQYRALLAERRTLLADNFAENERLLNGMPEGRMRSTALGGLIAGRDSSAPMNADLDKTQSAEADAIEAVLNWGQAQAGALGVRNGQLLFATKAQQAELQSLLSKLSATEEVMNKSVQSALKTQTKMQKRQQQVMVGITEYLAK